MQTAEEITGDITMADLLRISPGAQRALFRQYHIGGCASCGFRPDETLAQVCARNDNLPLPAVIDYLLASRDQDQLTLISPADLAHALNDPATRLIDVRTREEFEAACIPRSHLLTQELMQQIIASWDRNALTVFIDHQGARSMDAAAYFAGHGFTQARALAGGIDAWSQQIDPSIPRYTLQ